ncbi:Drug/metabolite transporter [Macleaya cordata]|uniref:WAT1-related protein n=1 Tax=Macleaya cordata TaxID=56857 RepID=A0A200RB48_MACCD|nr:Drug/metabolite transporter [Macleaya cordata]
MSEMKRCNEWQPVFLMVAIDFALAIANVLLKKVVDKGMNHLVLITYRTSISAVFLAPMAYFWERKTRPKLTSGILCHLFLSAMLGATLTQYFFLLGIQHTSVTFSCAFINMVPVITFIMALPFGLETVDIRSKSGCAKVLGTIVCVGGAMILTLYKGMPLTNLSDSRETGTIHTTNQESWLNPNNKTERWTIGTIALVAGSLVWSSWFLVQARISKRYPCQYSSTTVMCFFGTIQSALLSLVMNRKISVWVLKGKMEILTVLYAGIVGSGLCFVGMSWCVKKRGPLFTAAFSPLIQIIVAMFDFSILHEQLHLGSVLGSILVIVGLYILLWGKSKEAKACVAKQVQEAEDHDEEDQASSVLA